MRCHEVDAANREIHQALAELDIEDVPNRVVYIERLR